MTIHRIIRNSDGTVLASAPASQVRQLEGNWYFHPDGVNEEYFETSDRIYECPKKGYCLWVDMKVGNHYINDCSWIYTRTYPDYDFINGWYGFYSEHKNYTHQEAQEQ